MLLEYLTLSHYLCHIYLYVFNFWVNFVLLQFQLLHRIILVICWAAWECHHPFSQQPTGKLMLKIKIKGFHVRQYFIFQAFYLCIYSHVNAYIYTQADMQPCTYTYVLHVFPVQTYTLLHKQTCVCEQNHGLAAIHQFSRNRNMWYPIMQSAHWSCKRCKYFGMSMTFAAITYRHNLDLFSLSISMVRSELKMFEYLKWLQDMKLTAEYQVLWNIDFLLYSEDNYLFCFKPKHILWVHFHDIRIALMRKFQWMCKICFGVRKKIKLTLLCLLAIRFGILSIS